ncbi:hypothetical protein L7F22_057416 [Adiantum nelumboides]|nr:hypothetical protein [Adiantum nelumboides]
MALHEALVNGIVVPPQQNPVSPSKQAGSSRAPPLPLNLSGLNQGMSSEHFLNTNIGGLGTGGFPSYATSVRGGLDPQFRPTVALSTGLQRFPFPMVNPLWNMEMEGGYLFNHHLSNKDKPDLIGGKGKNPASALNTDKKDTNEKFHEAPPEASDDPQKEDKDLFEDAGFEWITLTLTWMLGNRDPLPPLQMMRLFLTPMSPTLLWIS